MTRVVGPPAVLLFAVFGLIGLSANPMLVPLAVRYGGDGHRDC